MPRRIFLLCVLSILAMPPACTWSQPTNPSVYSQNPDTYYAPAPAPAPAAAAPSAWPMQVQTSDGQLITIFQPQMESFTGDQLSARAAVSIQPPAQATVVTPPGQAAPPAPAPVYGAVWIQSRVATDRVNRTVLIQNLTVTKSLFPGMDATSAQSLASVIQQVFAGRQVTLSLDQLTAMVQTVQQEQTAAADLKVDPPAIIIRNHPAVKVQYDGTPKLVQVEGSNLLRIVNTPFFVVLDPPSRTYFLKGAGRWYAGPDALGPFTPAVSVPAGAAALAIASGYQDPQQPLPDAIANNIEIVTATVPTELLWTDGQPQMSSIPGTDLLYVANTDADLFLLIDNQQMFVLISGRWYTAASTAGPWSYVPANRLPPDFARIPLGSPKADVLASVPGTQAAADAIANADIPQTATIDLRNFQQPPVEYDGDPNFQPIEGTPLTYAVNTPCTVVLTGGQYYCCYNAVWYIGRAPRGPWSVCVAVPREIYGIPPSCPIYPCRFVYVYGHTDEVVYVGYTPGYVGCFVSDGVVVYGTGYVYSPWIGPSIYYARPFTFGFAARYDAYNGHWGFAVASATGGGGLWIAASHNSPQAFDHGGPWFGYGGYRPEVVRYARPGILVPAPARPDAPPAQRDRYLRSVYSYRPDVRPEPVAARPAMPAVAAPRPDDVYAGKDGSVYRKTLDGWEVAGPKGDWAPVRTAPPEPARVEDHPQPTEPPVGRSGERGSVPPTPERTPTPAEPGRGPAVPVPDRGPAPTPVTPGRSPTPGTPGRSPTPPTPGRTPVPPTSPANNIPDLNRDLRARTAGDNRPNVYTPPSPPVVPTPRIATPEPTPRGGGASTPTPRAGGGAASPTPEPRGGGGATPGGGATGGGSGAGTGGGGGGAGRGGR